MITKLSLRPLRCRLVALLSAPAYLKTFELIAETIFGYIYETNQRSSIRYCSNWLKAVIFI